MKLNLKGDKTYWVGHKSFLIGTFFLASALPISGLFFLLSILISFLNNKINPFDDKWNYPLFFAVGILIFSPLSNSIFNQKK